MANEEIVTSLEEINNDIKAKAEAQEATPDIDPGYEAASAQVAEVKTQKEAKGKKAPEFEIEIVDDTPPEDKDRKPMKTPPKEVDEIDAVNDKVQKRLDELKRAWHDERRAKEKAAREQAEALAYAKQVLDENNRLKTRLTEGEKILIQQAQARTDVALQSAKRSLKDAQESGDADKVAEAMSEISRATMEQENWKRYQPQYEESQTTLQPQNNSVTYPQVGQQSPPPPDDKAIAWYNKNTWFGVDTELTAMAYAQHENLIKSGVSPQSDEYYERIDARLRQVFPDRFEDATSEKEETPEPPKVEKRQQATVVAPATRTTSSKKITLTKSQVAIARRLGVPLEVYAKQVAMQENR
jgi:hypothetical protein